TGNDHLWAGGQGLFTIEPGKKTLDPVPGNLNDSLFFGKDTEIMDILPDGSRLWLATSSGIIIYNIDDKTWEKAGYNGVKTYLPGLEFITDLFLDADGTLWATSWGAGLLKTDTSQKVITDCYLTDPGKMDAAHNILNGIAQTDYPGDGDLLWISAISGGFFAFNMRTHEFTNFSSKNPEDTYKTYIECSTVSFYPGSGLWIGSRLGFYQYDYRQQMFREYKPFEISDSGEDDYFYYSLIYADPIDSTGNTVFLGTNNRGLFNYNLLTGEIRQVNDDFGGLLKPEIYVSDIYRDEEGTLWVATLLNGLLKDEPGAGKPKKLTILNQAGDEIKWINEFLEDVRDHSKLWVATNKGLFSFDKFTETTKQVTLPYTDLLSGNSSIHALFQQDDGTLWFIGNNSASRAEFLARLRPGSDRADIVIDPVGEQDTNYLHMNDLACTKGGEVFITSYKGLYHFYIDAEEFELKRFNIDNQYFRNYAEQILIDRSGNLWVLISDDLYLLEVSTGLTLKLVFENLQKNVKLNLNDNMVTGDVMLGSWF
ncbi:MAG: hypothetical protein HGA23_11435, partial [Bacteroidales bacterium]|nr:hypothetical protein [Bacteroidales bacterium]